MVLIGTIVYRYNASRVNGFVVVRLKPRQLETLGSKNTYFHLFLYVFDLQGSSALSTIWPLILLISIKMVLGDNRSSSWPKRPRTDGPQNEGDWTCPNCGNVNFAFRTACNIRSCSASKPADFSSKSVGVAISAPYGQAPPTLYVGASAGPTPMYIGGQAIPPSYGGPMSFGGASGVHYDMPFSGASGIPYDYSAHVTASGAYGALHMPTSYGHGAVIGPGPGYGAGHLMDGYGMGTPLGRGSLIPGLRSGAFPDENGSRKRRGDGLTDGDWVCPKCGNTNFSFRTICNMRKCGTPKPTGQESKLPNGASKSSSKAPPPEGSWTCEKCGNINYPFRTKCNRTHCGADKPSDKSESTKFQSDEDQ